MDNELDLTLFEDIKNLINNSKTRTYQYINSEISWLYFNIGHLIEERILKNNHEKNRLEKLSKQLTLEFGKGWSVQQLRHCLHFYRTFKDFKHLKEMITTLNWSSIKTIMYLNDPNEREFYIINAQIYKWSSRTLKRNIDSLLYQRSLFSQNPEELIQNELIEVQKSKIPTTDMIFKDPYILDFLNMPKTYSENDLETALVNDIEETIKELGDDFYFVGRQYQLQIDDEDYYIDLLFYHFKLKCHIAIDLKLGKFKAQDKGQMELYLRWLEKYKMSPGDNPPIGLILCSGYRSEHIELMRLDQDNIRVAEYILDHPDMKALEKRLKERIKLSRERYELEHSNKN